MELMRLQHLGNSNDDFLSAGGSNQSLHDSTSEDTTSRSTKNEIITNLRSKSLGFDNIVNNKNDQQMRSSMPDWDVYYIFFK